MVTRINGKPIKVEEKENSFSLPYLIVTCVGYGFIFWIIRYAAKIFLGVF
jgi:hypothetical protein